MDGVEAQQAAMDDIYGDSDASAWAFHYTDDPVTRYLRDRRLRTALRILEQHGRLDPDHQSVLVVCGGVGGEGTFLRKFGFSRVTVSDLSEEALAKCRRFDPQLSTLRLNAEDMKELEDASYDLVFVQDGLHHLPRPPLGFTEMLRVARVAAVVIEPHYGLVGRAIGTEWEVHGDAVNYVFRWNRPMLEQVTRSYLLSRHSTVTAHRMWDHALVLSRLADRLPARLRLSAIKAAYACLRPANRAGNMMIGVAVKPLAPAPPRLLSH